MLSRLLQRLNATLGFISVRHKLLAAFVVLSATVIALGGLVGNRLLTSALNDEVARRLTADVDTLQIRFDALLRDTEEDLRGLAAAPAVLRRLDPVGREADDASLRAELDRFLRARPACLRVRVLGPAALELARSDGARVLPQRSVGPEPFYLYLLSRTARGLIGRASIEVAGSDGTVVPAISFVQGLYAGDELIGLLVADLLATAVFPASDLPVNLAEGTVAVLDTAGRYLYHSDYRDDWNAFVAQRSMLSLQERYSAAITDRILAEGMGGSLRSNGDIVSFRPILEEQPNHLILVRTVSQAAALAPARRLRQTFVGLLLAALLLSVLLAHGAAQQFTGPIQRLVVGAREVAAGDYRRRIELGNFDELDHLAAAFNSMAEAIEARDRRIRAHTERLEDEVRERTRELLRAERLSAVGELVTGIAHEVGTPLNVISGYAENLQYELSGDESTEEDLQLIVAETRRIADLVRGLQELARPQPTVRQAIDLAAVTHDVTRLLKGTADQARVSLEVEAPEAPVTVYADPSDMKQAILNLGLNAIQASSPDDAVTIRVDASPSGGRIRVADNGSGIADDTLERIFEPFFTTKVSGEGTGLGLAIVRRIVEQHRGTLEVETGVGRGSAFELWLPGQEASVDLAE